VVVIDQRDALRAAYARQRLDPGAEAFPLAVLQAGRSFTATPSLPWMAFDVSQTMMTLASHAFEHLQERAASRPSRPRPN
jgi:hypothetical protein